MPYSFTTDLGQHCSLVYGDAMYGYSVNQNANKIIDYATKNITYEGNSQRLSSFLLTVIIM